MKQIQETGSLPPDILVTGHFKETFGYATYRSRGSGNWLITYTLQGEGLYRQLDGEVWARPGDIVLLQPGTLHNYAVPPDGTWEFHWAHFQPRLTWLTWWHLPAARSGLYTAHIHSSQIHERIQQVFLKLHADMVPHLQQNLTSSAGFSLNGDEPQTLLQRELALNGLEEILLLAVRENTQGTNYGLDPRIQDILDLVSQNLKVRYDLPMLAAYVALSPSRLSHLFKQEVGDSVANIILTLRLKNATRLLEFSTLNINIIAEEVGFNSAFYFSRQFHQRFGMSPRDYRTTMASHSH